MPHRKIVDKICKGSDCRGGRGYCLLSEILSYFGHAEKALIPEGVYCAEGSADCVLKDRLIETPLTDRTLIQMKCLEIYKYEESAREGRDIGWNEAFARWVRNGYAAKFAEVYSPNLDPTDLYKNILGRAA